jgi:phenylacetate-CoA ligase
MHLKVERTDEDSPDADRRLADIVASEVREQILVRTRVEVMEYGMLPRTERKSKRVFDHRTLEG